MSELETKYQKLATEYAKIRAQVAVLKKALLDEKSNGELLKDVIKEKEQIVRKYEQEIDSLTLRNQQLESRITILQKDLNDGVLFTSKKNAQKMLSSSVSDFRVKAGAMDEELRLKIDENISLHRQILLADMEHKNEILQLEDKYSQLTIDAEENQIEINKLKLMHESYVKQIMEEKIFLEATINKSNIENKELTRKIKELEDTFINKDTTESKKLHDICDINIEALRLENGVEEFNWEELQPIYSKLSHPVTQLLFELNNFVLGLAERSAICALTTDCQLILNADKQFQISVKSQNESFEKLIKLFKDSTEAFTSSTSIFSKKLKDFMLFFNTSISLLEKVLQNQIHCFEIENNSSYVPSILIDSNVGVNSSITNFLFHLLQAYSFIQKNIALETTSNNHIIHFSCSNCITILNDFTNASKEMHIKLSDKFAIEVDLPTTSNSLKNVHSNIGLALQKVIEFAYQICKMLEDVIIKTEKVNQEIDTENVNSLQIHLTETFHNEFDSPELLFYQKDNILSSCSDSISNNKLELNEFIEQQIIELHQQIANLQVEKECWALDMQLLKLKYDKKLQNYKKADEDIKSVSTIDTVENEILKYHEHVLQQKIAELQYANAKAVYFHAEWFVMQKRMLVNEEACKSLHQRLQDSLLVISQLKEEVGMTTSSYEEQLGLMSEHLASLNETLVRQKEQIDSLTFQLQQSSHQTTFSKKIKS